MKQTLVTVLMGLATARLAHASTCDIWQNNLDPCDGVISSTNNKCGDFSKWQPQDYVTYNNWHNGESAENVCNKYWQKHDSQGAKTWVEPTATAGLMNCYMDQNDNNVLDNVDRASPTTVSTATVTRDLCCDEVVQGPYTNLARIDHSAPTPTPGADFTPDQKNYILNNNRSRSNLTFYNQSDAGTNAKAPAIALGIDYFEILKTGESAPQIDHIIPKKDSNSCGCGTNAYSNAIVISAKLNNQMKNICLPATYQTAPNTGPWYRRQIVNAYK